MAVSLEKLDFEKLAGLLKLDWAGLFGFEKRWFWFW